MSGDVSVVHAHAANIYTLKYSIFILYIHKENRYIYIHKELFRKGTVHDKWTE